MIFISEDQKKINKAVNVIVQYGGIDGTHHKQWVIDQILRILVDNYEQFIKDICNGEDGPDTYEWDVGIAP